MPSLSIGSATAAKIAVRIVSRSTMPSASIFCSATRNYKRHSTMRSSVFAITLARSFMLLSPVPLFTRSMCVLPHGIMGRASILSERDTETVLCTEREYAAQQSSTHTHTQSTSALQCFSLCACARSEHPCPGDNIDSVTTAVQAQLRKKVACRLERCRSPVSTNNKTLVFNSYEYKQQNK